LTSHTSDDGFHEIQLNGKQLVFLFMAATVVSVVIFLCGVLVGRGVRAGQVVADAATLDVPIVDQTTATAGAAPAGSDPREAAPPTRVDDLSYFNRLEKADPAAEELKQPSAPPASEPRQMARAPEPPPVAPPLTSDSTAPVAPKPTTVAKPAPAPATKTATPPPSAAPVPAARSTAASAAAGKAGYVVQLAALNSQGEADAMANRLKAKGYQAYVQGPANGAPSIFRVRVGSYSTRSEAEGVAAKLEKEGQFKPWVAAR
jgi:DedD protein